MECSKILEWLERDVSWKLHTEYFFDQYEAAIDYRDPTFPLKDIFNDDWIWAIKKELTEIYNCQFNNFSLFGCHKFIDAQGVGIHNDDSTCPSYETHRLVIYFNESYHDSNGGNLVLFGSKDKRDIRKIIRPLSNSYFGFAVSNTSYHAVTTINNHVRYSLNLSFWDDRYSNNEVELFDRISCDKTVSSEKIYKFLIQCGAKDVKHSSSDVYSHLVNTACVLLNIGSEDYLMLAALFHSIYGTSCAEALAYPVEKRDEIVSLIGPKAEEIAYLYCMIERKKLYRLISDAKNQPVLLRNGLESIVSINTLADLLLLDVANSIEQYERIGNTQSEINDDLEFYLRQRLLNEKYKKGIIDEYSKVKSTTDVSN